MRILLGILALLLTAAPSAAEAGCRIAKMIETKSAAGGGAFATPGAIFVNRAILAKMPPAMRLFAIAHECGHQFVGRSEDAADLWAAQEGKRRGWLTASAVTQICGYMASWSSSSVHSSGVKRCNTVRRVFAGKAGAQRQVVASAKEWGYKSLRKKSVSLSP